MKLIPRVLPILTLIFVISCGLFWTPDWVKIDNPEQTVKDARQLIQNYRDEVNKQFGENTKDANSFFEPDKKGRRPHRSVQEYPESLKIEGLKYALICYDHIDLIFLRNPDFEEGLRIWSSDAKQLHEDKPTKYAEIYHGYYNNDDPVSPSNIP